MDRKRDLEVESLKAPKGATVPTVKGLQDVIDGIYEDLNPLEQSITALHEGFQSLSTNIQDLSKRLEAIQRFFSDFVLMIGKIDTALSELNHHIRSQKEVGISRLDIFEVRDMLADLLAQSKFSDLLDEAHSISKIDNIKKEQLNEQK